MFTVSCYSLHPIIAKILALWRWAQAVSDWLTFLLSICCCQCWASMPPPGTGSDNDSISCYKMLSSTHTFIEIEELGPNAVDYLHSDEELDTTAHPIRNLHITDSTMSGPSIYLDQACGEPRGQQLVLDFAPTAGDGEIELRSQVYDLESSHGSGSTNITSDSEAGLSRAQGDHSRAQYRASHYAHGSDMEVEVSNHLPEYESSNPVVNRCSEPLANRHQEEMNRQVRCDVRKALMSATLISFQPPNVKSTVGSLQLAPEFEVKSVTYEENLAFQADVNAGQKEIDHRSTKAPSAVKALRLSDKENSFPAIHNCNKINDKGGRSEFGVSSVKRII